MNLRVFNQCPAAIVQVGPPAAGPSVICGVMLAERRRTDQVRSGDFVSPLISADGDADALNGMCMGTGLPVIDAVPEGGQLGGTYTQCPFWRGERERSWEAREMIAEPKRRGETRPFGIGATPDPADFLLTPDQMADRLDEVAPAERR